MIKCPVCRAPYKASEALNCRRCGAELEALIRLHDQARWYYNQAIAHRQDHATAIARIQHAIALHSQCADFHAFAGQLWAAQGKWKNAIAAWRTAQQIDPNCKSAIAMLHLVEQLRAEG